MIQVTWDNDDHTIINTKFEAGWTLQHLIRALDEMYALVESVDGEVYVIFDLSDAPGLPNVSLASLRTASLKIHPRIRRIVDVTTSSLLITLTTIFKSVYREGSKVHLVKSRSQAYLYIKEDKKQSSSNL